jgi:hypothetical protein
VYGRPWPAKLFTAGRTSGSIRVIQGALVTPVRNLEVVFEAVEGFLVSWSSRCVGKGATLVRVIRNVFVN